MNEIERACTCESNFNERFSFRYFDSFIKYPYNSLITFTHSHYMCRAFDNGCISCTQRHSSKSVMVSL